MKTYFILDEWNRAIKIGRSVNPEKRLKQLQTGHASMLRVILVLNGDREHLLHTKFAHLRRSGEWFKATNEILQYVCAQSGVKHEPPSRLVKEHTVVAARAEAPLPKLEPDLRGWISAKRHAAMLGKAFTDYHKKADQLGVPEDRRCLLVPPLSQEEDLLVADHQAHLAFARNTYANALNLTLDEYRVLLSS